MRGVLLLVVILATIPCYTAFLNEDIIVSFCRFKNSNMGTIFGCLKHKNDKIYMSKYLSINGLRLFNLNSENTLNLEDVLSRKYNNLCVIMDADCDGSKYLIEKLNNTYFFYETHNWLVMSSTVQNALDFLNNAYLNVNSDLNLVVPKNNFNDFDIYDVYNQASQRNGKLIYNKIGDYSKENGYKARVKIDKFLMRKNMTGVQFSSAIVIPQLSGTLKDYLANDNDRQINSLNRFQSVNVDHCREFYNFSLNVERTNSWGYIQKDTGRFDGLVSLLEHRLVDFGSSPLLFKRDRMPCVDYGFGNWILKSAFIYKRPRVEAKSYEIFLRPLSSDVWLTICIMLVFIILSLKLAFTIELHLKHKIESNVDPSWSFLMLFTLGAFCQQGATCYPLLFSSRILSVFVFLFCILTYQFYSASIVSYLLMDPPRSIFNLKDLVESKMFAGIEDILIDRDYFVQTTDPYAIELYEQKIKGATNNSGFYSPFDGISLVRQGGFAFHVQTSSAYPIIEQRFTNEEICDLEEIQMYRTQPMYTNLQKHSPFRDMLNYCMLKMVEDGKINRLRKHWDARKPACIDSAKKVTIHVSLKEFSCGLIVLAYGILFSLIFLIIEIMVYHKEKIFTKKIIPIKTFIE